ncbi:DUF2570 domain-containing protein [Edwardsiella piscicida]
MRNSLILVCLLVLATAAFTWQTYQRGKQQGQTEEQRKVVADSAALLQEVRNTAADARNVLAQIQATAQQRNTQGEERREAIRADLKNDTCASTAVPDRVVDRLRQHAARATGKDPVRAHTAQPDRPNTNATAPGTRDMGTPRHLGG